MTRVLLVDDHDFFRGCMVDLVNANDDMLAVGECSDGADVPEAVVELSPHVVLMDVQMPRRSGLEAVAELRRRDADARVIMFTSDNSAASRDTARRNGAVGYLIKGADSAVVLDAVRHVATGGTAWPEDVAAGFSAAS